MRLITLFALITGAAIGLFLPDVDRTFPFLMHRSILTHSALIPLLGVLSVLQMPSEWKRAGVVGVSVAVAVHLAFDLFPQSWRGFALIWVPLIGPLNMTLSVIWLLLSVIACLSLALRLLRTHTELAIAAGVGCIVFAMAARSERVFWPVLLFLLCAALLATCLPNRLIRGQIVIGRAWRRVRGRPVPKTAV